jgi:steroid delta-isomerase-like uncharacterized protein
MSAVEKIAIHRRYNDDVINQGNLDLVNELFTPDYVEHQPGAPDIHRPEGMKQFLAMLRTAFPDAHFTVEDRIVDGDKIAVCWTMRGTQQGDFQGIPPTGRSVTLTGMAIHHFADNRIQESWDYYDSLGLLQQLGALPAAT